MAKECEKQAKLSGEIEIDESCFGAKRVRGKRGRGSNGKTPVSQLLKRNGKVYTQNKRSARRSRCFCENKCNAFCEAKSLCEIVKNCSANKLLPILREYSELENSTIYSDTWKAYDGLVDYGAKSHYMVKHCKNEFVNGRNHINGIESFWAYTKHRLTKFKGIRKDFFYLYLKESEFWYYTKINKENLYKILLKLD